MLCLKAEKSSWVLDWRVEAEQNMKDSGKAGMSLEQVTAYAQLFLPAYEIWADTIDLESFGFSKQVRIGKNRLPVS